MFLKDICLPYYLCTLDNSTSSYFQQPLLHVYLHGEPQVRLICSSCMRICQRRAAHISATLGYANGYRYGGEYDWIGVKSVYIRAFWSREDQSINKSF
jgi:hypothetical protein